MKAIYLASGKSSRMAPFAEKNLLSFFGVPLCIHLMQNAIKGGVTQFLVVTNGENTQQVQDLCEKYAIPHKITIQKDLNKGIAGGVTDGLTLLEENTPFLIICGNDVVHSSVFSDLKQAVQKADGAILAQKRNTYFPGGYLTLKNNKLKGIIEKPGEGNEPSDLVNIFCHAFAAKSALLQALKQAKSTQDDVYEVALAQLFTQQTFVPVQYTNFWQAVKYPWHIFDVFSTLFPQILAEKQKTNTRIHASATIHPSAVIGDNVIIEKNVKIMPNAVVNGQTYLGEGVIVGNNTLIRHSHISANSSIGFNSEIARSFLFSNVTTHIAYIGDSIIGEKVNFGAYSCTANLRLDQKNVKTTIKNQRISTQKPKCGAFVGVGSQIGVHACLMPGSILQKNTLVMPSSVYK